MRDGGEQHATGAAGGVVDALAGLWLEHLGHQVDDRAIGVELGSGVTGVIGEFLDEILVALAQFVLRQVGDGQLQRAEMLDQVAQHGIGEAVLIGPLRIAEDAVQLARVGLLDLTHGFLDGKADVFHLVTHILPVRALWNLKAVVFCEDCVAYITFGFF